MRSEWRIAVLVLTTTGESATAVETAYQKVGNRHESKSLKFAGLAADFADWFSFVEKY
jgi:hypothetical protein